MIDLAILRESYECRKIKEVVLIPSEHNPTNALTKEKSSDVPRKLMEANRVCMNPNSWVERRTDQTIIKSESDVKSNN